MDKILDILRVAAPTVATALGGPLAGMATKFLVDKLGLPADDEQTIVQAVQGMGPEQIVQLKQMDTDFQKFLKQNDLDLEKIAAGDRADARNREVQAHDSWTPRILATVIVGGWLTVQWFLISHVVDDSMREIIARLLGTLDAALMAVLYYYFGSSASSASKNATIQAAINKK